MKFKLVFLMLLFVVPTVAKTWVVKLDSELTSVRQAIQLANAGDTILVMSGIYKEGNILVNKSLTITGKDYPTFDGEFKYEVFTVVANNVTISNLHIINTGVASLHDLAAIGGEDIKHLTARGNRIENAFFGIHLANAKSCLIENNTLNAKAINETGTGNGIHLWKSNNITVRGNSVDGHRDGIYFEFVTDSKITNNVSTNNLRYGLHFMFSHSDTYTDNLFRNNGSGIAVMYSKDVTMVRNRFEENWGPAVFGLLLKDISESTITQNVFYKNTVAIYLEGCSRNKIVKNEFRENGWALKLQASCDDNLIEQNNFVLNTFDIGTNGILALNDIQNNYWDKYQGYDLNHDGVGDIPFHPVSLYSMIVEKMPTAVMLWRSFLVYLLDRAEKVIPAVTPENLRDNFPVMKLHDLRT